MGHSRIGRLPATRKWREVIALVGGGADTSAVAAATARAAEASLDAASKDPVLKRAALLSAKIPLVAREGDFAAKLRGLGLEVGDAPTLVEIGVALTHHFDQMMRQQGRQSDFGEIAQLSLVESLVTVAGAAIPGLIGSIHSPEDTRIALAGLCTPKRYGELAGDFFARLTRRCLDYYLSRELPNHVGIRQRFHSMREHRDFERALEAHCVESSHIMREFAGDWFSKANYQGGIDQRNASGFAQHAFTKMRAELAVRSQAHV